MFQLKVNNTTLDLPKEFAISFFILNPLFSDTNSHTLDFDLILSDKNKQALQFPDDPYYIFTNYKIPAKICSFDELLYEGTLTLAGTSDTGITASLTIAYGNFWENASLVNMKDLDWGSAVALGNDTSEVIAFINDLVAKAQGDVDLNNDPVCFNFPMLKAEDFYGDKNTAFQKLINYWDFSSESIIENIIVSDGTDNVNAVVPFFYLTYIFEKIAAHFGMKTKGSLFADTKFKNILLLNNFDLARKIKNYFIRATKTTNQDIYANWLYYEKVEFYDDATAPNEDADNVWSLVDYTITARGIHRMKAKLLLYNYGPVDTLVKIGFLKDTTYINFEIITLTVGESLTKEVEFSEYMADADIGLTLSVAMSVVSFCRVENKSYAVMANDSWLNLNRLALDLTPANHMPDRSVADFIKSITKYLGFIPFVNDFDNTLYICRIDDIFNDPEIIDITNWVSGLPLVDSLFRNKINYAADYVSKDISIYSFFGEFDTYEDLNDPNAGNLIAFVKATGVYYYSAFDEDLLMIVWKKYTDNIVPVLTGNANDELLEILPDVSPAGMDMHGAIAIIPSSAMQASSPAFETSVNDFNLELVQYHGMQEGPMTGKDYPCASILRYGPDFTDVSGYDLTPEWIANNHMKQYFYKMTRANRILSIPVQPSYQDIRSFRPWKRFRIHHLTGIFIALEGEFKSDSPGTCILKFLPI